MYKLFTFLLLSSVSLSAACKTTTTQSVENNGPRKSMLQYQDPIPLPQLWERWTPIKKTQVPSRLSNIAVFDYWQVKDDNEIEAVWSVLSTLLTGLRSQIDDSQRKLAIQSTLTLLEPAPIDRTISTLDFTFLTSSFSEKPEKRWEGVVIRWRKNTHDSEPTITLFLSRKSTSKNSSFDRATLWVEPGFSELPLQTFQMKLEETWKYQSSTDLIFDLPEEGKKYDAKIYVNMLSATLWKKLTGSAYVKYVKMEKETSENGFGEIKLRDIEMVFERTQFPPRFQFK